MKKIWRLIILIYFALLSYSGIQFKTIDNIVYIPNLGTKPDSVFFFGVWNFVKSKYFFPNYPLTVDSASIIWKLVKKDINKLPEKQDSIIYAQLNRLIKTLPKGYNFFLNPEKTKEYKKNLLGINEISGIGIQIIKYQGKIYVFRVFSKTPAEKADLKRGDEIIYVDLMATKNLPLSKISQLIRGKENTKVTLTIKRLNSDSLIKITIIRKPIMFPRIEYRKINNNIYYIRLYDFLYNASLEFYKALNKLGIPTWIAVNQPTKILILDLRDNPGGIITEVKKILDLWINGHIFNLITLKDTVRFYSHSFINPLSYFKTIILVNKNTASASEILIGTLKDYGLAKIVGDTSYGKGSFQTIYYLPFNTMMGITSGAWSTPTGKIIDGKGFSPDYFIKFDTSIWLFKGVDNQLEYAKKLAKKIDK